MIYMYKMIYMLIQITIQNGESELTRLRKERDEAVKARDERKAKYDKLAQTVSYTKCIFLRIILLAISLLDFQYMELKKKNTNIDEIKEKLKKYYKLYVSTGVLCILQIIIKHDYMTLKLFLANHGLCKLPNQFVCSKMFQMWFDTQPIPREC